MSSTVHTENSLGLWIASIIMSFVCIFAGYSIAVYNGAAGLRFHHDGHMDVIVPDDCGVIESEEEEPQVVQHYHLHMGAPTVGQNRNPEYLVELCDENEDSFTF